MTAGGVVRRAFDDLTVRELHDLLALRARVFVVEQDCAFQEVDGLDPSAEHAWVRGPAGEIAACLRVLGDAGTGGPVTRLGRIVSAPEHRGTGVAAGLVREVLAGIDGPVVLGAQSRARGFYERFGFVVSGPPYDEDGIEHVPMRRPGRT